MGTHLANNLLIPKIAVKAVWTDLTLMHKITALCLTVTHLSFITMRWIPSTWTSWAPCPCVTISALNTPLKFSIPLLHGRITGRILTKCFNHIIMDFLDLHIIKILNNCSWFFLVHCYSYWVKYKVSHLHKKDTRSLKFYVHLHMVFCFTILWNKYRLSP